MRNFIRLSDIVPIRIVSIYAYASSNFLEGTSVEVCYKLERYSIPTGPWLRINLIMSERHESHGSLRNIKFQYRAKESHAYTR